MASAASVAAGNLSFSFLPSQSDLVVMMDAVSTSAKCPTPHPLCAVIPVCDPVFRRTEPLRFATRPELRECVHPCARLSHATHDPHVCRYPEFGEMVGSRIAALREAFGKESVEYPRLDPTCLMLVLSFQICERACWNTVGGASG